VTPIAPTVRSGKKTRFVAQDRDAQFMTDLEENWLGLSEQLFRFDKWNVCRV